MRLCPLPDLDFEALFVEIRRTLLENLVECKESPGLVNFLCTLSQHVFINEYIYNETEEETRYVKALETELSVCAANQEEPALLRILILACYRPLHQYTWCEKIQAFHHLSELKSLLIDEPINDQNARRNVLSLGRASDATSLKVREQYDESPYPRWVKVSIPTRSKSIRQVCEEAQLQISRESVKEITNPEILIAGCGTGHSIETASRFADCRVTAVDLSSASLAYAQRKTNELGITNINYLQADILDLSRLDKKFDIIECAGVLHHMDDPMAGWGILTDLLRPKGLMNVGLYSELARRHIVTIRDEITSLDIEITESSIRTFRKSLAQSSQEAHCLLRNQLIFSV